MLNLAPWRYRHIFAEQGGPVSRIEYSEISVLGNRCFQANAYLDSERTGTTRKQRNLYSNADGTGTHRSAMVARYMAISEAIERWAFQAKVGDFDRDLYGFDRDASSNGMAAFPGIFERQCRAQAYWEALERFCLVAWWDSLLGATTRPTKWPGVMAAQIEHPLGRGAVVILSKHCMPENFYSYGHAAGKDFDAAAERASIELCRNEFVLRAYRATHPTFSGASLLEVADIFERRLLSFSLPEGHARFQAQVEVRPARMIESPALLFDGPIYGPWTRYATVWRVALDLPSDNYLRQVLDCFFGS